MNCDSCGTNLCIWDDLSWNGRYKHADTLLTVHKHKMMTCDPCQNRVTAYLNSVEPRVGQNVDVEI